MKMRSRRVVILIYLFAIVLLGLTSWVIQNDLKENAQRETAESLKAIVETSHQAIKTWVGQHKKAAELWANSPTVKSLAKELIEAPQSADALSSHSAQQQLRFYLQPVLVSHEYEGFFIIGPGNINLASRRNQNIGEKDILMAQESVLQRLWSGKTAVSAPMKSDVPLPDRTGKLVEGLPTMFIGAPIANDNGKVIALFTFRLDPANDFTTILRQGYLGDTGETYAFDEKGRLISNSRFEEQLHDLGLINKSAHGILDFVLRDPGVDLTSGNTGTLPREQQPLTRMAASAITGKAGIDTQGYRDYRGVPVVGAWLWDEDLKFGITTELDVSEAYSSLRTTQHTISIFTLLVILLFSGVIMLFVFINQRRRVEEKLRESEARIRLLLDSVGEGVFGVDLDGNCTFINPAALRLLGYESTSELVGKNLHALIHHSKKDGSPCTDSECKVYAAFRQDKSMYVDDEVLWRADGTSFDVEYRSNPVYRGRKIDGAVASFADITKRKQSENLLLNSRDELERRVQERTAELVVTNDELRHEVEERKHAELEVREKERFIQAIINSLPDSIAVIDREGVIISVNEAWREHAGQKNHPKLVKVDVGENYLDACRSAIDDDFKEASQALGGIRAVLANTRADYSLEYPSHTHQEHRWYQLHATPFTSGEGGAVISHTNITQRKEMEDQARQHQYNLAHIARVSIMGEMATGMAHELNQPLSAITTYSDVAMRIVSGMDENDKLIEALHGVRSQAVRASDIIRHLRKLVSKNKPQKTQSNLNDLLRESSEFIAADIHKNKIQLHYELDRAMPLIYMDNIQIEQVILNLLRNSIEALQHNITTTRTIELKTSTKNKEIIQVCVSDSGPGMDSETKRRIFEPFISTKGEAGMGMGLSISRSIIEDHGGRLWVESQPGQGSTFYFTLPINGIFK